MPVPDIPDFIHWDAALDHYHWDRLEEAYAEVRDRGIGESGAYLSWYRVIEAELISRRNSVQHKLSPWLTFEYLPTEMIDPVRFGELVRQACDQVATHFHWQHTEETLVAVLAEEADAPWATHPFGYCAHKEPYEKLCLPSHLVEDLEEFTQAVAHEYAHVVSESLADGHATRWLEEAISVFVEMRFDEETRRKFADGAAPWRNAEDLEFALVGHSELEDEEEIASRPEPTEDEVWVAYQQAGWIGRYLDSIGGGLMIADLLRKVGDESAVWNVRRTMRGLTRVEAALRDVYGLSGEQLFKNALAYLGQVKVART